MTTSEVLNFTEMPIVDNGIERFEFHEYEPNNGTNLNAGQITINIEQQFLFTLPSEGFLSFEGQTVKADGTAYANADAVALTNNGIMHLFSEISYKLSNQNIETIFNPGQATTMLGMLKYPNNFQLAQGLNQLWYKDSSTTAVLADNSGFALRQVYIIQKPTKKETFSFCVPLRHIFGFCYDYYKVIYGLKHTINLVRQSDDDAIFKLASVAAVKVNLNKISLFMPHVLPSDEERFKLYKQIKSKVTLPVSFCQRQCDSISVPEDTSFSWRLSLKLSPDNPRHIIVGFQTNKRLDQNANASIFDHNDLKNMYIMLNQERYPAVDYNLSFPNQQISRVYRDAAVFIEKFYGMNELITQSNINLSDYKDLYPLFAFNISNQSERLKSTTTDVKIKATFNTAVPAGTMAYAVVISDRMIEFQSDGNKMNIFY
ncbi:uncharacterized protein LOC136089595 [Hydra vulgaris]|uniref:Uncharacterized protein LOC136089595 n=1 Tax=Hydra vulgaris TaxID=6087 RepID=A0ABM4DBH8_HYDVU